jgi:hypothetical protein
MLKNAATKNKLQVKLKKPIMKILRREQGPNPNRGPAWPGGSAVRAVVIL